MKKNNINYIYIGLIFTLVCIYVSKEVNEYETVELRSIYSDIVLKDSIIHKKHHSVYDKNTVTKKFRYGFVKDEKVAIDIAKKVFEVLYEENNETKYYPYSISLSGDSMWIVDGTTDAVLGGGVYVEIRKKDGCVLRVIQTK